MSCLAHGLSHLFSELGVEEGLRMGISLLNSLSEGDLEDIVSRREPSPKGHLGPRDPHCAVRQVG